MLDFKTVTSKEIFLRNLKGLAINFGHISIKDKSDFYEFVIQHSMMRFMCHKEYRGILGRYKVIKNFKFRIDTEYGITKHLLDLHIGDILEMSELCPLGSGPATDRQVNGGKIHRVYSYVTNEERAAIYEM